MCALFSVGAHRKQSGRVWVFCCQKTVPICVFFHRRVLVVVQACTTHAFVIHGEAQRFDQVQTTTGVGCQTDDIPRVGRYFRLVKHKVEHVG